MKKLTSGNVPTKSVAPKEQSSKRATVWSGLLSFGLVSIPIRLHAGARQERFSFNQLCPVHLIRVQMPLFCPTCDKAIERKDVLKGYEHAKGQFIVMEESELKAMQPESASQLEITQFVRAEEVDPLYFESSFYVAPDEGGERGYGLLQKSLRQSEYIAIAKIVMHLREHVAIIRPYRDGLLLHTMFYESELRETGFRDVPEGTEGELAICKQLIDALAASFEPEAFRDEYQENLERLIQSKVEGKVIVMPVAAKKPVAPADLMTALQESITRAKASKKLA